MSRRKLQKLQNKSLKKALGRHIRYNTNDLHKEAGLATWEVQARIALSRLIFKYKYNEDYIDLNLTGRLTRLQSGPIFKKPHTDKFKNSVSYLGRNEWNGLPAYIRCIDSYKYFKRSVKMLFNQRFFHSLTAT